MADFQNKWLENLTLIIENHLGKPYLNNEFIAREMGISKRHFYRKIKEETGMSPNRYIREYILQRAMEMMESGKYQTVQEISLTLGFKNPYYFTVAFEKEFGERPLKILRRLGFR